MYFTSSNNNLKKDVINSLSGKFGTSMYSSEIGKCSGVALKTNLMEILHKAY